MCVRERVCVCVCVNECVCILVWGGFKGMAKTVLFKISANMFQHL